MPEHGKWKKIKPENKKTSQSSPQALESQKPLPVVEVLTPTLAGVAFGVFISGEGAKELAKLSIPPPDDDFSDNVFNLLEDRKTSEAIERTRYIAFLSLDQLLKKPEEAIWAWKTEQMETVVKIVELAERVRNKDENAWKRILEALNQKRYYINEADRGRANH